MTLKLCLWAVFLGLFLNSANANDLDTLNRIKDRGYIKCGVPNDLKGLNAMENDGEIRGFYSDLCRAVASSVLGSKDLVEFVVMPSRTDMFFGLKHNEIDLAVGPINWTLKFGIENDATYTAPVYYDNMQMLVHKEDKDKSVKDLVTENKKFCSIGGVPADVKIISYINDDKKKLDVTEYSLYNQLISNFTKKNCDVLVHNRSVIESILRYSGVSSGDYVVLPDILSKTIISPVVSDSDDKWKLAVTWSMYALIYAEIKELNIENIRGYTKTDIINIFDLDENSVKQMGLNIDFVYNIISQVGNYADIYDRTILRDLKIKREINSLGNAKGSLYSPSF